MAKPSVIMPESDAARRLEAARKHKPELEYATRAELYAYFRRTLAPMGEKFTRHDAQKAHTYYRTRPSGKVLPPPGRLVLMSRSCAKLVSRYPGFALRLLTMPGIDVIMRRDSQESAGFPVMTLYRIRDNLRKYAATMPHLTPYKCILDLRDWARRSSRDAPTRGEDPELTQEAITLFDKLYPFVDPDEKAPPHATL